jgi:hypothetical protein
MKSKYSNLYTKKLILSYNICIEELKNPEEEWEEKINMMKFTIDEKTRSPKTSYIFVLNYKDNIEIPDTEHTYVFKRSLFYSKFNLYNSRFRQELVQYFKEKGYSVDLYKDGTINRWCLRLSWVNTEIENP